MGFVYCANQYRIVVTLHFILDIEHELVKISLTFQQHDLAPLDVLHAIDRLMERVEALRLTDGVALKSFYFNYNNEDSSFGGVRLDDATQGAEDFKKDRLEITDCTLM